MFPSLGKSLMALGDKKCEFRNYIHGKKVVFVTMLL